MENIGLIASIRRSVAFFLRRDSNFFSVFFYLWFVNRSVERWTCFSDSGTPFITILHTACMYKLPDFYGIFFFLFVYLTKCNFLQRHRFEWAIKRKKKIMYSSALDIEWRFLCYFIALSLLFPKRFFFCLATNW